MLNKNIAFLCLGIAFVSIGSVQLLQANKKDK
jgi:hypothetical protein